MCNRNCKNCKYYEYQRTVDNEIHRCNCPEIFSSYEGVISSDEEIVNNFNCKYYERVEVKDMLLKPNKCEGEINMNTNMCGHEIYVQQTIIDLYYQKKSAQYSAETQEAIATIHSNSVCGRAAKNYVNYLKKNGVNEKLIPDYRSLINEQMLTPTELKMIDELDDAYHTAMNNLNKKCQECSAILATCETFEQKMVVLQNYDIVDCLYKLK